MQPWHVMDIRWEPDLEENSKYARFFSAKISYAETFKFFVVKIMNGKQFLSPFFRFLRQISETQRVSEFPGELVTEPCICSMYIHIQIYCQRFFHNLIP